MWCKVGLCWVEGCWRLSRNWIHCSPEGPPRQLPLESAKLPEPVGPADCLHENWLPLVLLVFQYLNDSSGFIALRNSGRVLEGSNVVGSIFSISVPWEPGPEWDWILLSWEWSERQPAALSGHSAIWLSAFQSIPCTLLLLAHVQPPSFWTIPRDSPGSGVLSYKTNSQFQAPSCSFGRLGTDCRDDSAAQFSGGFGSIFLDPPPHLIPTTNLWCRYNFSLIQMWTQSKVKVT